MSVQNQIEVLRQQVDEKNAELALEKTNGRVLSEKLKDIDATSGSLEKLMSQSKEIFEKLEEHINVSTDRDQSRENVAGER